MVLNTSAYADLMTPPREARMVGGPAGPLMLRFMGSRAGRPMIRKFFADLFSQCYLACRSSDRRTAVP